jgi:hypothetical protein
VARRVQRQSNFPLWFQSFTLKGTVITLCDSTGRLSTGAGVSRQLDRAWRLVMRQKASLVARTFWAPWHLPSVPIVTTRAIVPSLPARCATPRLLELVIPESARLDRASSGFRGG